MCLMQPITEGFVNRDKEREFLWGMARQEVDPRIFVVEGDNGMGKTYLLNEFRAECREMNIEIVGLDFDEHYEDPGYMHVVKETWSQLGPLGFQILADTMREIAARSGQKAAQEALEEFQSGREAGRLPQESGPASEGNIPPSRVLPESTPLASAEAQTGRSGGVNISGGINTIRDVVGRDVNYFVQVLSKEAPYVQEQACGSITEVLKQCLTEVTAHRRVVFFYDHWEKVDRDTRRWLARSIIKWAADALFPLACIVIAGTEGVDLEPRLRMKKQLLPELDENAIYTYLVDIYKIDKEKVPGIIASVGGNPLGLNIARKKNQPAPGRR